MKSITVKTLCLLLVTLLAISTFGFLPVFSHTAANRSFPGTGGLGDATIWASPEDSNFTSSKPSDLKAGDMFTVHVRINATKVAGWQIELSYDKTYLSTDASNVAYASDMLFPSGSYNPISPSAGDYTSTTFGYVLITASTNGAVEYNGTDKGLMDVNFTILTDPDGPSGVDWSWLRLRTCYAGDDPAGYFGTWTIDFDGNDNPLAVRDGYYENRYVPPPPAGLEISPTVVQKPTIAGDRIVGTPDALFSVDINIKGVDPSDELFLVQLTLSYNATLLQGIWIDEGTFMNDAAWAPHGTIDNSTNVDLGKMSYYVMIAPNASGYWDNTAWPSGDGLLATARFEVILQGPDSDGMAPEELFGSSALTLSGVFDEFFIGHPNQEDPDYLPYSAPVNGRVDIYGYYWNLPVAAFTWTPLNPLPTTIANFDGSASYGYKNVLGVLTPDPTVIVHYKWHWGDGKPDDESASPLMTHIFDAMGLYTVTLTVTDYNGMTDPESKVINVVFGRLIDVFTQYGPPFGGQGQNLPSDMFWPQKPVILTAILTYNGDPVQHKPVAFQVISPTGYWNFTRVVFSDSDGVAIMTFGLPWPCDYAEDLVFGVWTVVVKADIQCQPVEDLLWFKVYWYTHNMTVTPKETEYHKTETAEFDIDFISCSSQVRAVLVTLVVFDDLDVPVGQASVWLNVGNTSLVWCTFDHYHTTLSVYLPKYAYVGTGKVYVNTFFVWPIDCGYALSPEASAEFFLLKPP